MSGTQYIKVDMPRRGIYIKTDMKREFGPYNLRYRGKPVTLCAKCCRKVGLGELQPVAITFTMDPLARFKKVNKTVNKRRT